MSSLWLQHVTRLASRSRAWRSPTAWVGGCVPCSVAKEVEAGRVRKRELHSGLERTERATRKEE